MQFAAELTDLIDKYIIEDQMSYSDAHAKAWAIIKSKEEAYWLKFNSDVASRSVVI
jgi:hypothetical protein